MSTERGAKIVFTAYAVMVSGLLVYFIVLGLLGV